MRWSRYMLKLFEYWNSSYIINIFYLILLISKTEDYFLTSLWKNSFLVVFLTFAGRTRAECCVQTLRSCSVGGLAMQLQLVQFLLAAFSRRSWLEDCDWKKKMDQASHNALPSRQSTTVILHCPLSHYTISIIPLIGLKEVKNFPFSVLYRQSMWYDMLLFVWLGFFLVKTKTFFFFKKDQLLTSCCSNPILSSQAR